MREVTKEQFSALSTIDGRRIDKAVEDVVDRANAIEKRDLKRRFFQTQFVGSFCPSKGKDSGEVLSTQNNDSLPFLPARNTDADAVHEYRIKGTKRTDQTSNSDSLAATSSFSFDKPVVIVGLSVVMESGSASYNNDWNYSGEVTLDKADLPSDDVTVSISVDNPFLPENRELNTEVYHKFNFDLQSQLFRPLHPTSIPPEPTSPSVDMVPTSGNLSGPDPVPNMWGVCIDDQGLNIPVPRNSRARLSIVIPDYGSYGALMSGWGSSVADTLNKRPFEGQVFTWTLTVLEGAEE